MADPKLPGLNYETPVTITDLGYLESVYTDEFVRRQLATAGSYLSDGPEFGILSDIDPVNASTSNPFFIEKNATDGMKIDVQPGIALAENGMLIILNAAIAALEMVNQEIGQQNVVFVEYLTVQDEDTIVKTRFNTSEARRLVRSVDNSTDPSEPRTLQVVSIEDWNNNVLFPPDRRKNVVPIALVTIVSKTTSPFKEVNVDLSRTSLTANRPWFSAVDIAHRSQKGTGSSSVPHNLGLNDLAQGDMTLYDQLLNHGMVIGRDQDMPGSPGGLCFEIVTPSRVITDTTGDVTGTVSQKYVELVRYPIRLLGAYSISNQANDIAVELLPHTNILIVHPNEAIPSQGFRVQYTTVDAGEPLTDSLINDEIHFRQAISARELIISGGKGYTEVNPKFTDTFNNVRGKISLGTAAAIPKRYRVLLDGDGQLLFTPQHILCATKLDDIGLNTVFTFTTPLLGAARLRVGIFNATLSVPTSVVFRLTGTDQQGQTIFEDLTFNFANYQLPVVGNCEENSLNFQITGAVFSSATSLQILSRVSDGPNTAVCVYGDLDPMQTDAIRDACALVEVMWNGEGVCRIRDIRPVSSRLEIPTRTTPAKVVSQGILSALVAQGAQAAYELLGEDIRDPHRMKIIDPLRRYKFADGLRSSISPEQPGVESSSIGVDQDIYQTVALALKAGVNRQIHMTLLGIDAERSFFLTDDHVVPNVEWRFANTLFPDTWSSWAVVSPVAAGDGASFLIDVADDDTFKTQFRIKGSFTGVAAVQYIQTGGSLDLSGIRTVTSLSISAGTTHIISCPFNQSLADSNYNVTVTVSLDASTNPGDAGENGVTIRRVQKFVDHIKVWITLPPTTPAYAGAASVHWHIDRGYTLASTDGGFGDTVF